MLIKNLSILYDYGELDNNESLYYLLDLKFLKLSENKLVITKKWIVFSGKVSKEDFIASIICYYPLLFKLLLSRVYIEACTIGKSGDSRALFEFIDSVPKFIDTIFKLKNVTIDESEEIRELYQAIFKGYPQYPSILSKLKIMQLTEEVNDLDILPMGVNPNEIWIQGRRVASSVELKEIKSINKFTLTPYEYVDYPVEREIKEVLSYPWKTFLTVLCMVELEYKAGGFEGISIRPTDDSNSYNFQPLDFHLFNVKGREIRVGSLNSFVYEFCSENNIYLFPDKEPEVDKVVFKLMEEQKIEVKDGEYVMKTEFKDLIYSKDIIIKNRSRKFKNSLKEYIEKLRNTL